MKAEDIIAKVGEDRIREAIASDDPDSLKNLVEEEGIALSDEQLDTIAGGLGVVRRKRIIVGRPRISKPVKRPDSSEPAYKLPVVVDDPIDPSWTSDDDSDESVTGTC